MYYIRCKDKEAFVSHREVEQSNFMRGRRKLQKISFCNNVQCDSDCVLLEEGTVLGEREVA